MTIPELRRSAAASQIAAVCRRYRVRELAVFGSAARGEAGADSDVDLYVEFEAGYHPGLGWFDLEEDLEKILGRRVDLSRKVLLKSRVRREAERDAVVLYAAWPGPAGGHPRGSG